MQKPDLKDMQGVLINGYTKLEFCNYHLIQIEKPELFLNWLSKQSFQDAEVRPRSYCQNIAFTSSGLKKLGIEVAEYNGFSLDFIQGMNTPHKNRTLGDFGHNAPSNWIWGNDVNPVHVLLMQFCVSQNEATQKEDALVANIASFGIKIIRTIKSSNLPGQKEHFGFKDGISQPEIKGVKDKGGDPDNTLNPGEFILGYPNSYNVLPLSPKLGKFEFGKNGSYLVVRQLEQNVRLFWNTMLALENNQKDKAILLASKMVGRWPNGQSLVHAPSKPDESSEEQNLNHFKYHMEDKHGYKCPIGSHIRRTNPRNGLDNRPEESIDMVNRHRILRRGRTYGPPITPDLEIDKLVNAEDDKQERGLLFMCYNTDISRQFEFVQHTWANNRKFDGLYNDVDPIMGVQGSITNNEMENTQFEVQACPVRKRYNNIPTFVTVKGGDYFFLPGIKAIKYLAGSK